jgi:hypothetical protein
MDYVTLLSDAKINYTNAKFSSQKLNNLKEFNVDVKISENIVSPKIDV